MTPLLQQLSIHFCIFIVICGVLRLRQTRIREGIMAKLFLTAMVSLILSFLHKAFDRMDGSPATHIDVWRDGSLFFVMMFKLVIGWREGRA